MDIFFKTCPASHKADKRNTDIPRNVVRAIVVSVALMLGEISISMKLKGRLKAKYPVNMT
jgi:hypothetical protein